MVEEGEDVFPPPWGEGGRRSGKWQVIFRWGGGERKNDRSSLIIGGKRGRIYYYERRSSDGFGLMFFLRKKGGKAELCIRSPRDEAGSSYRRGEDHNLRKKKGPLCVPFPERLKKKVKIGLPRGKRGKSPPLGGGGVFLSFFSFISQKKREKNSFLPPSRRGF